METRRHTFTYTSTKYALGLLGVTIGSLILLLIILLPFAEQLGEELFLVVIFLVPLSIYYLLKKNVKRTGRWEISQGVLHLELGSRRMALELDSLKIKRVDNANGTKLKIRTKDGERFKIIASREYCDPSSFRTFATDLEKSINDPVLLERQKCL